MTPALTPMKFTPSTYVTKLVPMSPEEATTVSRQAALQGYVKVVHFDVIGARSVCDSIRFENKKLEIDRRVVIGMPLVQAHPLDEIALLVGRRGAETDDEFRERLKRLVG